MIIVQQADRALHHKALVAMAKTSTYISSFGSPMFSGDAAYDKGWVRMAVNAETDEILGFTCVRHKTRSPETMLYFIIVDPDKEGRGIGQRLMADLEEQTPHRRIALKVMKDNERAIEFYRKLGYVVESEDEYKGEGLLMAKELPEC
mgnify:CR=1 FL=1